MNEHKIINDPVFGFIKIRRGLLYDIVQHPLFQRLNRIVQLGLASVVYPGARHTRFQHSLGAFHLMSEAVKSLTEKGIYIFDSEAEAVQAAILMHDIGHGPFSHVLENTLIHGISHEDISLLMMEQINSDMKGQLNLAISIFKDEYPNKIFHQLISSQLDMDRLDYLRRDSFYTGVTEGNIGSARIIKMLNVADDRLVVDAKGIYSIENYLTTRRLMYWQVYLHKTTVGYEKILVNALNRAKQLATFALLMKACGKDKSFLDAKVMPRVYSMPRPINEVLPNYVEAIPNFLLGANHKMIEELSEALKLMNHADTLGSIMKFDLTDSTRNTVMIRVQEYEEQLGQNDIICEDNRLFLPYMRIILALTDKYATICMNPPYMGSGRFDDTLSKYVKDNYPRS